MHHHCPWYKTLWTLRSLYHRFQSGHLHLASQEASNFSSLETKLRGNCWSFCASHLHERHFWELRRTKNQQGLRLVHKIKKVRLARILERLTRFSSVVIVEFDVVLPCHSLRLRFFLAVKRHLMPKKKSLRLSRQWTWWHWYSKWTGTSIEEALAEFLHFDLIRSVADLWWPLLRKFWFWGRVLHW